MRGEKTRKRASEIHAFFLTDSQARSLRLNVSSPRMLWEARLSCSLQEFSEKLVQQSHQNDLSSENRWVFLRQLKARKSQTISLGWAQVHRDYQTCLLIYVIFKLGVLYDVALAKKIFYLILDPATWRSVTSRCHRVLILQLTCRRKVSVNSSIADV